MNAGIPVGGFDVWVKATALEARPSGQLTVW